MLVLDRDMDSESTLFIRNYSVNANWILLGSPATGGGRGHELLWPCRPRRNYNFPFIGFWISHRTMMADCGTHEICELTKDDAIMSQTPNELDKPEGKMHKRTALKPNTVRETVYQSVLRKLQQDGLGPSGRILDYEVAAEFGCTRMPVRQALIRLVSDGYLIGTTRGFIVPSLTTQDVRNIFEVRQLLEPAAAASTVTILTADQLRLMSAACKACHAYAKKDDGEGFSRSTYEFREIWLKAIPNERLQTQVLRFSDHAMRIRRQTLRVPNMMHLVLVDLDRLLEAFLGKNAVSVRKITLQRLRHAEKAFVASFHESGATR